MNIKLNLTTEECNEVIAAIKAQAEDLGYDEDETLEDMIKIVDSALEAMGIECIWDDDADEDLDWEEYEDEGYDDEDEDEDFDWDKDYDDEEEDDDEEVYKLTPKGEFVARLLKNGVSYDNALWLAEMFYNKDGELKTEGQDKPKVEEKTKLNITIYNEKGHRVISKADADCLMEMIRRVVNSDKRIPMKDKETAVNNAFLLYCKQELKVEGVMRE